MKFSRFSMSEEVIFDAQTAFASHESVVAEGSRQAGRQGNFRKAPQPIAEQYIFETNL